MQRWTHRWTRTLRLALLTAALPTLAFAQESAPPPAAVAAQPYAALTIHAQPGPLAAGADIEDWPSFLGPRRDAHCLESPLDLAFGQGGPRLLWEMNCGEGFASPVVAGERLIYTHRVGDEVMIDCLQAESGKRFWRHVVACEYKDRYIRNGGPRSTPAISGERVFVHGVDGTLTALELSSGKLLWQTNTLEEFGVGPDFFGIVSSPLVEGQRLIQNLGVPGGPCVAGFDLATGKIAWGLGEKWGPSCSSPIAATVHGKRKLFVFAGGDSKPPTGGLMGIDLASATLDFEFDFRSRTYTSINGATPLVADNRVFLTASYGLGSAGIEIDEKGRPKELWKNRHLGQEFETPVLMNRTIYAIDGVSGRAGALIAVDPESGDERWRKDFSFEHTVDDHGTPKTISSSVGQGSLLVAGEKLLVLGDFGHLLTVVPGADGAQVIAEASLFQAVETWTPLVISHGLLYVCQNNDAQFGTALARLLCYDLRGESGSQ